MSVFSDATMFEYRTDIVCVYIVLSGRVDLVTVLLCVKIRKIMDTVQNNSVKNPH